MPLAFWLGVSYLRVYKRNRMSFVAHQLLRQRGVAISAPPPLRCAGIGKQDGTSVSSIFP